MRGNSDSHNNFVSASLSVLIILLHNPQAKDSLVMLDMHTFKLIWLFFSCADKKKVVFRFAWRPREMCQKID